MELCGKPTSHDLDNILFEGDRLYQKVKGLLRESGHDSEDFLSFSDLPPRLEIYQFKCTYEMNGSELLCGTCLSYGEDGSVLLDVAVNKMFENHNAALIIVNDLAFSVFLNNNGQYCLIHIQGTIMASKIVMVNAFTQYVHSVSYGSISMRYELQPLQLHREHSLHRVPLNVSWRDNGTAVEVVQMMGNEASNHIEFRNQYKDLQGSEMCQSATNDFIYNTKEGIRNEHTLHSH